MQVEFIVESLKLDGGQYIEWIYTGDHKEGSKIYRASRTVSRSPGRIFFEDPEHRKEISIPMLKNQPLKVDEALLQLKFKLDNGQGLSLQEANIKKTFLNIGSTDRAEPVKIKVLIATHEQLSRFGEIKELDRTELIDCIHQHKNSFRDYWVKTVTDYVTQIEKPDAEGNRPLHVAIMQNNWWAFLALLNKKAVINAKNIYGLSPIHLAFQATHNSRNEMIVALLEKGANLDEHSYDEKCGENIIRGKTPLIFFEERYPSEKERSAVVAVLLRQISVTDERLQYLKRALNPRPNFSIGSLLNPPHGPGNSSNSQLISTVGFCWGSKPTPSLIRTNDPPDQAAKKQKIGGFHK